METLLCLERPSAYFDSMELTKKVLELLKKQRIQHGSHTSELRGVLNAVTRINNQFGHGTQEDSYELLNTLLGGIFDELKSYDEKRQLHATDADTDEKSIDARKLFAGLFVTIYVYDSCDDVEVVLEEFTSLSIPVVEELEPESHKLYHRGLQTLSLDKPELDIEKGLAVLTQTEDFEESDLPCRKCNTRGSRKAYRRLLIFQPPPVLVIHIDRFKMNNVNNLEKNTKCVKYPRMLNIAKFCSSANTEISANELVYELYAVIVHTGAIYHGHYFAYVNTTRRHDAVRWQKYLRRTMGNLEKLQCEIETFLEQKRDKRTNTQCDELLEVKDTWFFISDQTVRSVDRAKVLGLEDAYILFYEEQ
ncbi:ubiquitin carboxyl-terminal hydrolase 16-like [Ostrea edulis]|uniref:ubiquitin carboxyl-terminal hydrolase 16-like n=1 Tax=Ostrea edulis TaxID=37623 RepID=UPI0024AF3E50|nr:ubiquitin carboxyl-terminal hydrolase 16-like [Ostrea edulis]